MRDWLISDAAASADGFRIAVESSLGEGLYRHYRDKSLNNSPGEIFDDLLNRDSAEAGMPLWKYIGAINKATDQQAIAVRNYYRGVLANQSNIRTVTVHCSSDAKLAAGAWAGQLEADLKIRFGGIEEPVRVEVWPNDGWLEPGAERALGAVSLIYYEAPSPDLARRIEVLRDACEAIETARGRFDPTKVPLGVLFGSEAAALPTALKKCVLRRQIEPPLVSTPPSIDAEVSEWVKNRLESVARIRPGPDERDAIRLLFLYAKKDSPVMRTGVVGRVAAGLKGKKYKVWLQNLVVEDDAANDQGTNWIKLQTNLRSVHGLLLLYSTMDDDWVDQARMRLACQYELARMGDMKLPAKLLGICAGLVVDQEVDLRVNALESFFPQPHFEDKVCLCWLKDLKLVPPPASPPETLPDLASEFADEVHRLR